LPLVLSAFFAASVNARLIGPSEQPIWGLGNNHFSSSGHIRSVGRTAKAKRQAGQAANHRDLRLVALRSFTMSTKINIAVVATVLALVAAPQLASAQQAIFLPDTQWNANQTVRGLDVPRDARAQADVSTHRRASHDRTYRALSGAYGAAPGYSTQERVYAPNGYVPGGSFPSGVNSDFQMQRSG